MRYKPFGKNKEKISVLGMGCMRLPTMSTGLSPIDEKRATTLIRQAIDMGINYLDTAPVYHNETCESFLGRALRGGYRERTMLATKMSRKVVNSREDCRELISLQLNRLCTDQIDMYLLHNVTKDIWSFFEKVGVLDIIENARERGEIKYIGFSSHEENDFFTKLVDSHDWDFCQIQFNYVDQDIQAKKEGLEYAASKGLDVVIMEPLKGGILARRDLPFADVFQASKRNWSPAEWSLRWIWNHPEVSVVLSGMNSLDQLQENCRVAEDSGPGTLSADDLETVEQARKAFKSSNQVPCSSCGYCLPCPQGVNIPRMFTIYNNHLLGNDSDWGVTMYNFSTAKSELASNCISCGKCEEKCPQKIPISKLMPEISRTLSVSH
ncbi:MAG TPA: aldo/keto reductase [Candidatus Methanomethylophilaceae archaeon]|nr:uncharacterized protein [Candidatus Methanomethylophilaceae archaeon]HIJ00172.1 aldo/keto reductase [Candidatus Methanomethylophilaceae archaeon]